MASEIKVSAADLIEELRAQRNAALDELAAVKAALQAREREAEKLTHPIKESQ